MKRIGILGGTFNPIHIGHLAVAQAVFEKLNLDKVFFIPSHLPPHKSSKNVIPAEDRLRMVHKAVQGFPHFSVSDFEVKRPGKSYTIDTVKYFLEKYFNDVKLFIIIGEDSFAELDAWKNVDELQRLATFVVVNRPAAPKNPANKIKVKTITMPELDVSSSYVRKRIKMRKPIEYLVPEKVWEDIEKNNFYKN